MSSAEVVRLVALLNFIDLITRVMPRALWNVSQALERIAQRSTQAAWLDYIQLDIIRKHAPLHTYTHRVVPRGRLVSGKFGVSA